jgi:centriolar protein POC1
MGHKSLINDLAVSPTGTTLASASSDHTVRIWSNLDDGDQTQCQILKHNSAPVKSVDFSCDSRLLTTGSDDKSVKIISINDKKVLANLTGHTNWVKCVRFSHDAKLIASSSDDKNVTLWDVNRKILNHTYSNVHNGVVNAVRFHPDNSIIGTACYDKKVRLFDVRSKLLVQCYEQHKKPVSSLSFHPQGVYMASTSYDETIKIFDLRNGQIVYTLSGHEGATTSINFSMNGEWLATGGVDALIILWKTNMNIDNPIGDYYNFPVENDQLIQKQSLSNIFSNKFSGGNNTNSDTGILYFKHLLSSNAPVNENFVEQNSENISEEMSKVFEKMVYQLELITK